MTESSFLREVNQDLRADRMRFLWKRFWPVLAAIVLLAVLGSTTIVGYQYWRESRSARFGDIFLSGLDMVRAGKDDEAIKVLVDLEHIGTNSYAVLARMLSASLTLRKGDAAGAVTAFDKIAANHSVPHAIRDMARLRAGLILVDTHSYDDVAQRVESISSDTNPMRHSAREVLGLAAWKAARYNDSLLLFRQIADDPSAPANIRQRANIMLDLMRSSGAAQK